MFRKQKVHMYCFSKVYFFHAKINNKKFNPVVAMTSDRTVI